MAFTVLGKGLRKPLPNRFRHTAVPHSRVFSRRRPLATLTSSLFATNPSLRCSPELLVRHRPVLTIALTAGCALLALAGCGSSASSSAGGATSSSSASAGTPVAGGNLVFANPQDAQSLDESTVFDNNSIWIIEQITQPLFTVTDNGKGVMPWLATSYTVSSNQLTSTI